MLKQTIWLQLRKHVLIGSRRGLNPGPFDLELPALPSELPWYRVRYYHVRILSFFDKLKVMEFLIVIEIVNTIKLSF